MIDLHLHTTVSDGRLSPEQLVERVAAAGVTVMAVTDHDTVAGLDAVRNAARSHGVEVVPGIEVTAIERGADVHILGYFVDDKDSAFAGFLAGQRQRRQQRARMLVERLAQLGMPVETASWLDATSPHSGRAIGRPQVARAMVAAGHVGDVAEAFERWLGRGRPAFVARDGPSVADVVSAIHAAGGLASFAHPGKMMIDERLEDFRGAGLDALEVYHPDHLEDTRRYYASVAQRLGMLITGGSDFHGDDRHGASPGTSVLPRDDWERLRAAGHA